jgi:hypothetical protein
VSRIRIVFTLFAAFAVASVHAGPGIFKKKIDTERVGTLIATLKSDPDEKKRKAAADELGGADSRLNPEVGPALAAALQKDASPLVRAEAATSLGELGQVFPVAGQALEAAAVNDSSPLVRIAARRTLWEYHLNGYRSPKGADGTLTQTIEPPLASPAGPRPAVAFFPAPPPPAAPPPVAPPTQAIPQSPPTPKLGLIQFGPVSLSSLKLGPRISRQSILGEMFSGSRLANRTSENSPTPIATAEPPRAKRPPITIPPFPEPTGFPPPTLTVVPKPLPVLPKPDYVPTLPAFQPELPSLVLPPDADPPTDPAPPRIPPTLPPIGEGPKP